MNLTHSFKKNLGQNFIFDTDFLNSILDRLNICKNDTIVEVGAGAGTLTKCLSQRAGRVIAYEIDESLGTTLREQLFEAINVDLIFKDILRVGAGELPTSYRVVANIPYYITTPIIMKFLFDTNCRDICVLVQTDVARRLAAPVGTHDYGALTVSVNAVADVKIIKTVPRTMFRPVPKVDSAFVVITRRFGQTPAPAFGNLVKAMFAARRKTCLNAYKQYAKIPSNEAAETLKECGIDPHCRPETVGYEKFVKLCLYPTNSPKY
jgi:16S rRNA (adenine1518-N6/adenine1519-N6)-dimethyltransferase